MARFSEDCPENAGVVILDSNDVPLGFGVTARSSAQIAKLDPTSIAVHRQVGAAWVPFLTQLANANKQADAGEYLREVSWIYLQILKGQIANIHYRRIRCSQPKQIRHDTEYYIFAPRKRRLGVLPDLFDLTKVDCFTIDSVLIAPSVMN